MVFSKRDLFLCFLLTLKVYTMSFGTASMGDTMSSGTASMGEQSVQSTKHLNIIKNQERTY